MGVSCKDVNTNEAAPAPQSNQTSRVNGGRRIARYVALIAASLVVALLLLELMQWTLWPAAHPLRRRPGPAVFTFKTDGRLLPGISGETHFTTESHGLRYPRELAVPKPSGVYRIFCVGGSTTECTYLDDADAWPARVETALRSRFAWRAIELINAGFSGLTSADHVVQIEEQLLQMEPDCIVLMAGMNDHIRRNSPAKPEGGSWSKLAMDYSMTVRRLVPAWRAIFGNTGGVGSYAMDASGEIYRRLRAACAATPMAPDTREFDALTDPLPYFESNIARIADVCRESGVTLVLVTHPTIYSELPPGDVKSLLWMKAILEVGGTQAPMSWHVAEMKRLNDRTRRFAREHNLILIDADAALPKSSEVFYDDCHLNVAGARLLGDMVTKEMESLLRKGS